MNLITKCIGCGEELYCDEFDGVYHIRHIDINDCLIWRIFLDYKKLEICIELSLDLIDEIMITNVQDINNFLMKIYLDSIDNHIATDSIEKCLLKFNDLKLLS